MKKPSHGAHKPRRIRWPAILNTMAVAQDRATKIDPADIEQILQAITTAAKALREGVATELQWSIFAGAIDMAHSIERLGVVRGMYEHWASAETALQSIHDRATKTGHWMPTALHYFEIDAMQAFTGLHAFQLRKLSLAEYRRAATSAAGQIGSAGNRATTVRVRELAGAAA